jgi:hypothetical protein
LAPGCASSFETGTKSLRSFYATAIPSAST